MPLFYEDSLGATLTQRVKGAVAAADRARVAHAGRPLAERGSADIDLIDDPEALDEAERDANRTDPKAIYSEVGDDWVSVFGPSKLSGLLDVAGVEAAIVTMPLAAEEIDFAWSPYPPEMMPGPAYPNDHLLDMPFTVYVAPANASTALRLITESPGSRVSAGIASTHERGPEAEGKRRTLAWVLLATFIGVDILLLLGPVAYGIYHLLRYHRL